MRLLVRCEIVVPVTGDEIDEPDETFVVHLAEAHGASVAPGGAQATVTIVDDDETAMFLFLPLVVR